MNILSTLSIPANASATLLMVKGKKMRKDRLCVTMLRLGTPSTETYLINCYKNALCERLCRVRVCVQLR